MKGGYLPKGATAVTRTERPGSVTQNVTANRSEFSLHFGSRVPLRIRVFRPPVQAEFQTHVDHPRNVLGPFQISTDPIQRIRHT